MDENLEIKLLRFETYGIKNLSKKITIDFSNKTIANAKRDIAKVKAIYGGNGSGKSAIINSLFIYKNVAYLKNYLLTVKNRGYINSLINKKCNEIYFKVFFSVKDKDKKTYYYSHSMIIEPNDSMLFIKNENFSSITGQTLSEENEKTIIELEYGKIKKIYNEKYFEVVDSILSKNNSSNSITSSWLIYYLLEKYENLKEYKNNEFYKLLDYLGSLLAFQQSLLVKLENEESNLLNKEIINTFPKFKNIFLKKEVYIIPTNNIDYIEEKDIQNYEKEISDLSEFIKVFKYNLKDISIEKQLYNGIYSCKKIFNYDDHSVDIEYESTGIKKLVSLFPFIKQSIDGKIVFIDEMDANINGVFLSKLIDFIKKESKGQLCYTTHNLDQLNELKNLKHSIDFISEDTRVIPWKKNGNYSPARLYREGMIDGCPFNFEDYSFYSVFETED